MFTGDKSSNPADLAALTIHLQALQKAFETPCPRLERRTVKLGSELLKRPGANRYLCTTTYCTFASYCCYLTTFIVCVRLLIYGLLTILK